MPLTEVGGKGQYTASIRRMSPKEVSIIVSTKGEILGVRMSLFEDEEKPEKCFPHATKPALVQIHGFKGKF